MKKGDIVEHRIDGDIGIILEVDGIAQGSNPALYEILWILDGHSDLQCYGVDGDNLKVLTSNPT